MDELFNNIKKDILDNNKDIVLILVHGSAAREELRNYSDIDIEVFVAGKCPENILYFKKVQNINRFVGIKFRNFKDTLNEIKKHSNWIWINWEDKNNVKVLFDKGKFFQKIIKNLVKIKKEYYLEEIPEFLWYKIEEVCKIKNAYLEKDKLSIIGQARYLAYGCFQIISIFNNQKKIIRPIDEFRRFFNLTNKPKNFEKDFQICTEFNLKEKNIKQIYRSSKRMLIELIYFLRNQPEIKTIRSSWLEDILFNDEIISFLK